MLTGDNTFVWWLRVRGHNLGQVLYHTKKQTKNSEHQKKLSQQRENFTFWPTQRNREKQNGNWECNKIKGSLSSSWMNSPIPSLLFSPVAKQVFVRNYWYENICHLYIHWHKKSFSCETFTTSTRSEKEANGNSDVEVKSAYVPSGLLGQHLFHFL